MKQEEVGQRSDDRGQFTEKIEKRRESVQYDEHEKVAWNRESKTISVINYRSHCHYMPITTAVHALFRPVLTDQQEHILTFRPKQNECYPQEFNQLSLCVLVLDESFKPLRLLGEAQTDEEKKQTWKQSSISSKKNGSLHDQSEKGEVVPVWQRKDGGQKEKKYLSLVERENNRTPIKSYKLSNIGSDRHQNSRGSMDPVILRSHEGVFNQSPAREQKFQQCLLLVTKFKSELEPVYRTNLFEQYLWEEEEIEFVMKQVQRNFGEFQGIVQKRRQLQFSFRKAVTDQFWQKWKEVKPQIMIQTSKLKKFSFVDSVSTINSIAKGSNLSSFSASHQLSYFIWSRKPLLSNQQLATTLFQLPNTGKIIDLCLQDPWIIIAATGYIFFLHSYKPMEYFKHFDKLLPNKVVSFREQKAAAALCRDGHIYVFSMNEKQVTLIGVVNIGQFLRPFCLAELMCLNKNDKKTLFIGGIDVDKKDINRPSHKRRIYRLGHNLRQIFGSGKPLKVESNFQVVSLPSQKVNTPLLELVATSKNVLACCCDSTFYLMSSMGHKLVEVNLKYPIISLMPIPFIFNLFNFVLLTAQGELVRLGIQSYGETLGSQVQKMCGQSIGCCLLHRQGAKFQMLVGSWREIVKRSYLKEEETSMLKEESGQIVRVASDRQGLVYLVYLEHSYSVKYLQL